MEVKIGDYITGKLTKFGVSITPEDVSISLMLADLTSDDLYTKDNYLQVETIIVNMIPELLLRPDKSQGDASIKFDKSGILNYYRLKCGQLGIPNQIDGGDNFTVTALNDVW